MIMAENTPNFGGIAVTGDYLDFEQLYEALHDIIPDEGIDNAHEGARLRALGFCYDLRHAMMGHRDFTYVDNGLNEDIMKHRGIVGSPKNIYLSFPTMYPEMLFVLMSLTYFTEGSDYGLKNRTTFTESSKITYRNFEIAVLACIKGALSPQKYMNTTRSIHAGRRNLQEYATQYIDLINIRYLEWDAETRQKNISIIAKRLADQGDEYQALAQEVRALAAEKGYSPNNIQLKADYPEDIDW